MESSDTQSGTSPVPEPAEPGAELEAAAREQGAQQVEIDRMAQMPNPVVVFRASDQNEGNIIRALLEGEGIPAVFDDSSASILGDAMSVAGNHTNDVLVAPSDVERAKALIDSYRNASVTDDMVGADDSQPEEQSS